MRLSGKESTILRLYVMPILSVLQQCLPPSPVELNMQHLDLTPAVLSTFSCCLLLLISVSALGRWGMHWHLQGLVK